MSLSLLSAMQATIDHVRAPLALVVYTTTIVPVIIDVQEDCTQQTDG